MLKTLPWRVMAFGCSVGVLAGLLAVAYELDFQGQGQICEYNQATKHEDCTTYSFLPFLFIKVAKTLNDYGVAITALATVAIGVFTLTLKLSTDKLWKAAKDQIAAAENAAKIQSANMNASIAVAKEAADAAKLSAQAAINVELPRLFATKIDFELATLNLVDPESSLQKISVTITNYGRTPAFLYCESAEILPGPLPAVPIYPNAVDLEPGILIEKGQLRTLIARCRDNHAHFDARPFVTGQKMLWVYGIIRFQDFLNERHALRFCADLHVPQGLAAGHPPKFIQGGPTTYTESY
jgi:hypothetical protein